MNGVAGRPQGPLPRWLGRYELVRPLGVGGHGRVVEAVLHGPRGFRKRVALKLLHSGTAVDGVQVAGLVREARFGAMLSHPNVVSTLELGEVDGVWFVSMELVPGWSLSAMLRERHLSPAALVDVGIQACAALSHVHELVEDGRPLGLVHRDVKPGNLLLHPAGLVRLADFGVAGLTAEIAGGTSGTPGYMAPEQIGGRAEARSDLFGLGMTLLSAAAGANPLGRGITALHATGRMEALLAAPEFLAPADRLLPGLGEVLRDSLRHDPDHRYPNARALAAALRTLRGRATGPALAELVIELPPEPAPPPSADTLPTAPTVHRRDSPLLGRAGELGRLVEAAEHPGVWTLVGPAGVGKTRLAAEVAIQVGAVVVWCDLVSARTVPELCAAVALGLGTDVRDGDPVEQVGRALAARGRALVVLDNLEQVVDLAAPVVERWSSLARKVTLLGTSRAPLRILGESVLEVTPLELAAAVQLFGSVRGRAVEGGERDAVEEIVRRVDRLPLAIELVAVRARPLPVDALLQRLDDQLRLLSEGPRTGDPRHRTVHAAIGWSWELLQPAEQVALAQLSVLEGSFTLEVAEALVDVDVTSAPSTLDLLTSLVEQSLAYVRGDRFDLLELVRAFARRELGRTGETAAAERRHGEHFASWGSNAARRALRRPGGAERLRALCEALPDLVAACRRAVARGDGSVAVPTALAAMQATVQVGPVPSGLALADTVLALALTSEDRALLQEHRAELLEIVGRRDEALAAVQESRRTFEELRDAGRVARLRVREGVLLRLVGRLDAARVELEEGLAEARRYGQRFPEALALTNLAWLQRDHGHLREARDLAAGALAVYRAAGDRRGEGGGLTNLGILQRDLGEVPAAQASYTRALEALREVGDRRSEGIVLGNLGLLALLVGEIEAAAEPLRHAIQVHRTFGALQSLSVALGNLGIVLRELERPDEARACYEEALAIHRDSDERRGLAIVLGNLAQLDADDGQVALARERWAEALALHEQVANVLSAIIARTNRGRMELDAGNRDLARADLEAALEAAARVDAGTLVGAAHIGLGRLARVEGRSTDAVRHLAAAQDQLASIATAIAERVEVRAELGLTALAGSVEVARTELAAAEDLLAGRPMHGPRRAVQELRAAILARTR